MAVKDWSVVPGSNNVVTDATLGDVRFTEDQPASELNDSFRTVMAHIRSWYNGFVEHTEVAVNTSIPDTEYNKLYLGDASAGAISITLPACSSGAGRLLFIGKGDSSVNTVTILPSGSDTVDGGTSFAIMTNGGVAGLLSDGTGNWYLIAGNKAKQQDSVTLKLSATLTLSNTLGVNKFAPTVSFNVASAKWGAGELTAGYYKPPSEGIYLVAVNLDFYTGFSQKHKFITKISGDGGATFKIGNISGGYRISTTSYLTERYNTHTVGIIKATTAGIAVHAFDKDASFSSRLTLIYPDRTYLKITRLDND